MDIYTHCESLPAHAYPEFKNFPHLAGHYGGAWHDQREEFEKFPGAILATSNCALIPRPSYKDRLFTSGIVGLEGVKHIEDRDFEPVIGKALSLPELPEKDGPKTTVGFHHTAILGLAGPVIDAVKAGKIRHFFLIGGCSSPAKESEYYTQFAKLIPKDCVLLTLACIRNRLGDMEYGSIDGIPRYIDIGQCNNAYSAIQVAAALAKAFNCSVNELPLSLILSWVLQDAVTILLTLFHLGVKGIRLGPKPPVFVSKGVFEALQNNFDLRLITTPEKDLKKMLKS